MTRKEAKRRMECCRDFLANNYSDMGEPNFTAFNMAIEALSAEPCENCISREKAIKALEYDLSIEADGGLDKYRTVIKDLLNAIYNTQKKAIEDLPSIQPQPKTEWIPVSERLPETSGEYFITIDCGEGFLCTEFSWFYIDNKVWSYRNAKILAWMPLPEPYKAESEDKYITERSDK